ncbi:hypothetical protein ACVIIV_003189 [Bradyrhizobium sp. USDA 4354]
MKPGRKRKLVDEVGSEWQVSIRTACVALEFDRSTYHYNSRLSGQAPSRSATFVFATVIVVFTSCSAVKAGAMARTRHSAFIANWACNCATKCPSAGSRPSCATTAGRPHDRTRPGRWILSTISRRRATARAHDRRYFGFSPVLQPRFTFRGSDIVAILERACKEVGLPATIRVDQGSRVRRAILTCGPISAASRWTSHGPASRTLHRGFQRPLPGRMPQRPMVPVPCQCLRKSGDLAQTLQLASEHPSGYVIEEKRFC